MVKIGILSARVQDLGGFHDEKFHNAIKEQLSQHLSELKQNTNGRLTLLTGLNLGPETWAAELCLQFNIPYHVYIPFDKICQKWMQSSQTTYYRLLKRAVNKVVIDTGEFSVAKLKAKEIKIIEDSDTLLMVYPTYGYLHKKANEESKTVINVLASISDEDSGLIEL